MAKISACIISFNEENKIEDCLTSLLAVVDEIIIIDSLSTDRTVEIASKYTNKIFHQKFLGYSEQKNLAASKAENDWVLSLDCDERLSVDLQKSILEVKNNLSTDYAYSMNRRTFYVYRWINHCWYPDTKIRLFNKTVSRWDNNKLHERLITESRQIKHIKGDIQHYSFSTISEHISTIDRFTEIGADELIKKNKRISAISPLTHGTWTFIKLYFIKRGFMDGFAGLVVSVLSFMHVFVKYSKAIIKHKILDRNENS